MTDVDIGVVWWPELDVLVSHGDVDIIEVEPQSYWIERPVGRPRFLPDSTTFEYLERLQVRKLVHGVGLPVGGTCGPNGDHLALFSSVADRLHAPWVSEHLAFNRAGKGDEPFFSGFLLPPLQTAAGVEAAVATIARMQAELSAPLCIETGVNYLRPIEGELSDGEFVRAVAETAGCGILLDLHNAYTNERNGRQSMVSFLSEIPLDRVWELHVAGGLTHRGFWLDGHSGKIPRPVLEIAGDLVPCLPRLGAIVYEILPIFIERFSIEMVREQLASLRRLRSTGANRFDKRGSPLAYRRTRRCGLDEMTPEEWEDTLASLVSERPVHSSLATQLEADPAIDEWRYLVRAARGSMLSRALPATTQALIRSGHWIGLFDKYVRTVTPQAFASTEAWQFAGFVRSRMPENSLIETLENECSVLQRA